MEKITKNEKTLGLPPMELAEGSTYINRGNSTTNIAQKCFHPWLKKVIGTIILTALAVGTYTLLLRVLQSSNNPRTTEIIIVTGDVNKPNITIKQEYGDIVFHLKNKTSQPPVRRKRRSVNKEKIKTNIQLHDEIMQKARAVIQNHDALCDNSNPSEFCKGLVKKLDTITDEHSLDSPSGVKLKLRGLHEKTAQEKSSDHSSKSAEMTHTHSNVHEEVEFQPSKSSAQTRSEYPEEPHYLPENSMPPLHPHLPVLPVLPALPHLQPLPVLTPPVADTCLLARLLKHNPQHLQGVIDIPVNYFPQHSEPIPYNQHVPQHPYPSYLRSELESPYYESRAASDVHEERPHPQDVEIFMRYHTTSEGPVPSKEHNSSAREADCALGSVSCADGETCVPESKWCDGMVDCRDASDEVRCPCKARVDKSRLCDGYFDCPFGEDEMGCYGCSETTFSCENLDLNSHSTCFTKEQRCDNIVDCPNRKDEMECNLLAPSLHDKPMFAVSNTEGFLQRNFKGTWYPVCNNPYMWAHDACRRETGLIIRPPYIQMIPIDPTMKVTYLNTGPGGVVQMSEACVNSSAVYVTCPDLLCGTRVPTTPQILRENTAFENHLFGRNKRFLINGWQYPMVYFNNRKKRASNETQPANDVINFSENRSKRSPYSAYSNWRKYRRAETRVVGGKPSQPAAWPWMVAMYRDGMFHCGGVVISSRWIVSAAHCVTKFWEHYYEIQVGMLRRFSFSPQESNHQVTHVIVNQNYDRIDMKNDLSLLRVKPSIQFSRWVRPICLPGPETAGPDFMWGPPPGTICTAVGWGATVEHGPDPDHMREVEVPIWQECNHSQDRAGKEICAGPVEGGKDACQGDSGGPLLCRNPLNLQQWYMAGIVSHGDGCARKGEPGVYTRVSIFVKWIKYHIFSKVLPIIQPKQECPGFKCISGIAKCLPKRRMCDKVIDCLDGEDEMNCNFIAKSAMEGGIFLSEQDKNILDNVFETKEAENSEEIKNFADEKARVAETLMPINENTDIVIQRVESTETEELKNISDSSTTTTIITTTAKNFEKDAEIVDRGDMGEVTLLSSIESLESRASIVDMKDTSRETDVSEHWEDTTPSMETEPMAFTNNQNTETTTVALTNTAIDLAENKELSEQTVTEETLNEETEDQTTKTIFLTTLPPVITKNNKKAIKESKELFTNLPLNDTDRVNNSNKTFSFSTLSSNLKDIKTNATKQSKEFAIDLPLDENDKLGLINQTHFGKGLSDSEGKTIIIDKIKDIISSKLQPAKIKKKHRSPETFDCRRIHQQIPYKQRCDRKADCEDGTDELGCSCVDYIQTFDEKLICDGTIDCADGQDENDCFGCSEKQYLCKWSKTCLPLKHVCDGVPQCPQGEDELDCFALTNGKNIDIDFDGRPKISLDGYVTRRHENSWNIVCQDSLSIEQQEEAASHICRYLGFSSANRYHVKYINIKDENVYKSNEDTSRRKRDSSSLPIHFEYRKVEEGEENARNIVIKDPEILKEQCVPNVTKTCMSLYVFCDHTLYTDFSNYDIEQELVLYGRAEGRIWPWTAKVYVEGNYSCSGILVDLSWVLISHSCLWDSLLIQNYVTVVLGSQRALRAAHGPYEQVYQVDGKKDMYHSQVALLHLKSPAHYTTMVKPMAIPAFNGLNDEKAKMCVAVGQDDKNKTVSVFLEETEEKCNRHSRCFVRQRPETICSGGAVSGRPWTGIVSCHGNEGWYPAASFVEIKGECGVGDRIVGTDVGNLKSDMKHYIGKILSESTEHSASDPCDGSRCSRGRCVRFSQLCDGVTDCEDGLDETEESCGKKQRVCEDDPHHRGCGCTASQLKCKNGKCVNKERFGDGKNDCGDSSDEPGHVTCAQYLARVSPLRLCDGILHCHDKTDEDPLFCKCFSKKSYKCGDSDHCVAPDLVCDGSDDCPSGEDETTCIALSAPDGTAYGTGEVIVRSHGVWHSKCYSKQNHTRSELENICRQLGFISGHAKQLKSLEKSAFTPLTKVVLEKFDDVVLNNNTSIKMRSNDNPIARAVVNGKMENCHPLFIECL